jgi:hypothetical protein
MLNRVQNPIRKLIEAEILSRPSGPSVPNVNFANSTFSITPHSFAADGIESALIEANLEDANGNKLEGRVVNLSKSSIIIGADSYVSLDRTVMDADNVEECNIFINLELAEGSDNFVDFFPADLISIQVSGTGNTVTQATGRSNSGGTLTGKFKTSVAELKTISVYVGDLLLTSQPTVDAGGTPPTPPPSGDPDYETGFEAATFSELNNNGWIWANTGSRSTISTDNPRTGSRSMRMAYQAAAAGADSTTQRNFNFGQNVTEFWMEWYFWLPSNYTLRAGESPSNNKWLRIWGDDYSALNKVGASTAYSASFDDNSRLRFEYIYKTYTSGGIGFGPSGSQSESTSFGGSMKNTWTRIRLHCKMVSTTDADDGVMELWFGNTKVIDFQNMPVLYDSARPYWNQGYILGAANSGFLDETILYVDDWKVYFSDPEWSF